MATQWQTFPIEFKGGLISNLSALQHGTNAIGSATILQNLEPTKEGGYSKIRGYTKWDTSVVPGSGPVLGIKVINSGEVLAVRSNGTNSVVYHSSGSGWISKLTMTNNGGRVRFAELNFGAGHKVLIVDGSNYPAVFDDSTNAVTPITSSTDLQGSEFVAVYKTTVFYAKGTNLYFTAPSAYDNLSAANGGGVINVGHAITGLAVFRDQLIVFSRNSIKRLTGSSISDFLVSPITDRIGCISGDTIQEVGGDIMYAAPDGLRLLSATDRIGDFGLGVASDIISKDAYNFLQSSSDFCSLVLREKAQYRIFAYVSSEQQSVARGLLATKFVSQGSEGMAWGTTKGIKAFCADSKYTETYDETTIFANEDGYVYELDTGSSFEGNIIEAIYESPYMPITDPQTRKTFYKMTLYAEPTGPMTLDVNFKYDFDTITNTGVIQPSTLNVSSTGASVFFFGGTSSVFGTSTYGGELDRVYNTNVIGSGKTVAIRIEDSSTNPTFTLDTAILEFRQNDRQ
jgi:hypothetical protein